MATKKTPKIEKNEIIEKISELVKFAADNKLNEFELDTEEFGLKLKKNTQAAPMPFDISVLRGLQPATQTTETAVVESAPEKPAYDESKTILIPLNGIFYRAKSPTSEPIAKEGDYVAPGSVIGLVSACKNLNEIISDKSGKIAKFLIKNEANVTKGDIVVVLE